MNARRPPSVSTKVRPSLLALMFVVGCVARPREPTATTKLSLQRGSFEVGQTGLMDAAVDVVGANVGALIHVEQIRGRPASWNITRLAGWGDLAEDLGLDAIADLDRVFIAAPAVISCQPAIVLRHHLPIARVDEALDQLVASSKKPARRILGLGFPAVVVATRKRSQVVFAPDASHVVMLPAEHLMRMSQFVSAKPLPAPIGDEAWIGWSNPSGWPPLPPMLEGFSIANGTLVARLGPKDVVELRGWAHSTSSARENARILQHAADQVSGIPVIGGMIMDPVEFTVRGGGGDEVFAEIVLSPADHKWFLAHMAAGCW